MKFHSLLAIISLGSLLPTVGLACGDRPGSIRNLSLITGLASSQQLMGSDHDNASYGRQDLVGTWIADWFVGHTSQRYDRVLTIFHADGNETENDIAVPPATENLCFGVWEQTDRNKFTMRHVGWVFDITGAYQGAVEVVVTVSLTEGGAGFQGKYVLEQYDPAGNIIPADHADGDIKGTRYTLTNGVASFLKANP